jgi:hypothetical protein
MFVASIVLLKPLSSYGIATLLQIAGGLISGFSNFVKAEIIPLIDVAVPWQ